MVKKINFLSIKSYETSFYKETEVKSTEGRKTELAPDLIRRQVLIQHSMLCNFMKEIR